MGKGIAGQGVAIIKLRQEYNKAMRDGDFQKAEEIMKKIREIQAKGAE